jgi:hypothetical protein
MNREVHVRIWERPEVRVLWATRQYMKPAEHRRRCDVDPAPRLDSLAEINRLELIISCQQPPAAFEITQTASVSATERVVRLRSRVCRRSSSAASARVTEAGERPNCLAASAKLCCSATATKIVKASSRSCILLHKLK